MGCRAGRPGLLIAGTALAAMLALPVQAHDDAARGKDNIEVCASAAHFGEAMRPDLSAPYDDPATLARLLSSPLGASVLKHLWMNASKAQPCFAISDTPIWGATVSRIPADVVGLEVADDLSDALIYVTGVPDYTIETPPLFTGFKPGNIYGVYRIAAAPQADTRDIHEFVSMGQIGFFVNGSSIFNYTDSFSYRDKGAWVYDANVAEASIVNSDVAHATPSNLPQFPKGRGIFHNHQMSRQVMKQLDDPYARGERAHSKVVGYAIDSHPIYGPLGYTSKDQTSGLKLLRSSYVKREWATAGQGATDHRSSLPGWVVRGWNGAHDGDTLLNLFQKPKADLLFADGATQGPVTYGGTDEKLAAEIRRLQAVATLERDEQGYVYWQAQVKRPDGGTAAVRNYLLNSSDLWGPDIAQKILPVSYQAADPDKFLFAAVVGAFAEDYEFIPGYGDLDFYNGIESFVPDLDRAIYHYVTPYAGDLGDPARLGTAQFPYFIGIQFKGVVEPLNRARLEEKEKAKQLAENRARYRTVFDLGVVGKNADQSLQQGSVIDTWRTTLGGQ